MSVFVTMQNSFMNPSFQHRANFLKAVPTKRHLALNAPNLSHNTADEGDRLGGGRQGAWPVVHLRYVFLPSFQVFNRISVIFCAPLAIFADWGKLKAIVPLYILMFKWDNIGQ